MKALNSLEIYVGAPIEHDSERVLLAGLVEYFELSQTPALIFLNFHLGGRQIDAAVITERRLLLIEAKGYRVSIRGSCNGLWEYAVAGGWKRFTNPYEQALGAVYALRRGMREFAGQEPPTYPSGALMFVPAIPPGSGPCIGDFKVAVCGLGSLPDRIAGANKNPWPLELWRRFAAHHRLERVGSPDAACSPGLFDAEQLLAGYGAAFEGTYGPASTGLVELSCRNSERDLSSHEVAQLARGGESLLLLGPSGCGKTLLAWRIGVEALQAGSVPILIQAKDFDGRLKGALDHEATLLDIPDARALVRAAGVLNRRLVLIVDGYNECAASLRELLTRSMLAFARRYHAQLLLTSQQVPAKGELLPLMEVSVPEPDAVRKAAVAAQGAGRAIRGSLDSLLASVSSCLEARLVGEVGLAVAADASRYALFDTYVRTRLGRDASEGIRVLARLAGEMAVRVSFTLSVRERDRLVADERDPAVLISILERSNTLVLRGDRLSFRHELFFNAFAAESVMRGAKGQAAAILSALALPKYAASKVLIVGAIDDDGLAGQVLSNTGDPALMLACRAGECGAYARRWIQQKVTGLLTGLREEIGGLSFVVGQGWDGVGFDPATVRPWSPNDRAALTVLARAVLDGEHLDAVFEMLQALDHKISDGVAELKDDPTLRQGMSIRSALFANAYVFVGNDGPAIGVITAMERSGGISLGVREPIAPTEGLLAWIKTDRLSHGQMYLLLMLCQAMRMPADLYVEALCDWLPKMRSFPQHLGAEMLNQTIYCGRVAEPSRTRLIETLESLMPILGPFANASVFEGLQRLGALEDQVQAHLPVVREDIAWILANPDDAAAGERAYGVYNSSIDHPYEDAYCQVLNDLSEADRKGLLRLACQGAPAGSISSTMLIWDIARTGDPALAAAVSRWTDLPEVDTPLQQDAVQAFVGAHTLLGQHNLPLPVWDSSADNAAAAAMRAYGCLYYWVSRNDEASIAGFAAASAEAWAVLLDNQAGAAAYALYFCERHARYSEQMTESTPIPRLWQRFPLQTAEVCRQALLHSERQQGYYPQNYHLQDMLRFCVDILGYNGDAGDLPFLRGLCEIEQLGSSAIDAIRQLERG